MIEKIISGRIARLILETINIPAFGRPENLDPEYVWFHYEATSHKFVQFIATAPGIFVRSEVVIVDVPDEVFEMDDWTIIYTPTPFK